MKKKIIIFTSLLIGLTSCNLDVNDDPDYQKEVPAAMLLPSAQNFIAEVTGNMMYNYAGFFAQYYDQRPEANQYNNFSEYRITSISSQIFDTPYSQLYAGALEDLKTIIESEDATAADKYAATVLRAYSFQLLVDNTDKTPYTEALEGDKISMPKYDDGQAVYEGVLNEIERAEAELGGSAIHCNDLLLNKDVAQWKGFANALRLRMYLRFIDANVDRDNYLTKVKALVTANRFFKNEIAFDVYTDEASKRNPWYSQNAVNLTKNHCAAYAIVSYLSSTGDNARMAYNFAKATASNDYVGEFPGVKNAEGFSGKKFNRDYSYLNYYATKPVYFFTQSELQFLISEVYLRFVADDGKAKAAYEAAIEADFAARKLKKEDAVTLHRNAVKWSSATTLDAKLELIYMQKWVALCYMDHMEAWSEIRRTNCPKLSSLSVDAINASPGDYVPGQLISPKINTLGDGNMMMRLFPSYSSSQVNDNTPKDMSATDPVWWDK